MIKAKRLISLLLVTVIISITTGCKTDKGETNKINTSLPDKSITLTISAAASLRDALEEIKASYIKENDNVSIMYNFGSSGALQQQIEQGADADIFISAAAKQMDALKDKKLIIDDSRTNFLGNKMVLIAARNTKLPITDFKSLTDESVRTIALGEPKSVPAGQYAEEIFMKEGNIDKIRSKAVYAKDVKEVLTWVESGNADAGIVYSSDAKSSDKVKVIGIASEGSHKPVVYPAAVLKASTHIEASKGFLKYLEGDESKKVFERYGFIFLAQ